MLHTFLEPSIYSTLVLTVIQDRSNWQMERNQTEEAEKFLSELKSFSDNLSVKASQLEKDKHFWIDLFSNLTHQKDELQAICKCSCNRLYTLH